MICRKDFEVAKMSFSAPLLLLFGQNCGAKIDILSTSTSFRQIFSHWEASGKNAFKMYAEITF